jgi:CRISPR system Cascade subunit CasA
MPQNSTLDTLAGDLPVWERAPATVNDPYRQPDGPADLFTWPSRRVLLRHEGTRITGMILTNGVKLDPANLYHIEPMSSWRRSPTQEKKRGLTNVYLPAVHQLQRVLWRGLQSLLPVAADGVHATDFRPPGIITWLGAMADDDAITPERSVRLRAVGVIYGTQNSVVTDIVDDSLVFHAFLLSDDGNYLVPVVLDCVADTDKAVFALGILAANLATASGADSSSPARDGSRQEATVRAYAALDYPFRTWLATLSSGTVDEVAQQDWHRQATRTLRQLAQELVIGAGPSAFAGHPDNRGNWMTTGKAEQIFLRGLYKALPLGNKTAEDSTSEGSAS